MPPKTPGNAKSGIKSLATALAFLVPFVAANPAYAQEGLANAPPSRASSSPTTLAIDDRAAYPIITPHNPSYSINDALRDAPPVRRDIFSNPAIIRRRKEQEGNVRNFWRVIGSSAAFSAFDYVGYNLSKNDPSSLHAYRVIQLAAQSGLTLYNYGEGGLRSAIAFNTIWWTFGDDLAYKFIAETGIAQKLGAKGFEGPGSWPEIMQNGAGYAYWTALGVARGDLAKHQKNVPYETISGPVLALEAMVGLTLASAIVTGTDVDTTLLPDHVRVDAQVDPFAKMRPNIEFRLAYEF